MLFESHDTAGFRVGQTGIAEGSWVLQYYEHTEGTQAHIVR